jgi:hypothetical protein
MTRPWLLVAGAMLAGAALGLAALAPWGSSAESKISAVLREFDGYQRGLARLCAAGPLVPGPLSFNQTGIPEKPRVSKRIPDLEVGVSVVAADPATLLLTVTLPAISADGIHVLWNSASLPAGSRFEAKGRCEGGKLVWLR